MLWGKNLRFCATSRTFPPHCGAQRCIGRPCQVECHQKAAEGIEQVEVFFSDIGHPHVVSVVLGRLLWRSPSTAGVKMGHARSLSESTRKGFIQPLAP